MNTNNQNKLKNNIAAFRINPGLLFLYTSAKPQHLFAPANNNIMCLFNAHSFSDGILGFDNGVRTSDDSDHTFDDGDHTFDDGDHTFDDGDHTSDDGDHTFDDGDHTSDDGDHTYDDGDHISDDGAHVYFYCAHNFFERINNPQTFRVTSCSKEMTVAHLYKIRAESIQSKEPLLVI
jgi:hypothetical protein